MALKHRTKNHFGKNDNFQINIININFSTNKIAVPETICENEVFKFIKIRLLTKTLISGNRET